MKNNTEQPGKQRSLASRAAPPLVFLLAICLLVVFCLDSAHTSLPPTEKRYVSAKAGIASLKADAKKNMQREPWEKLATEFRSIYDADPDWPNRPAALFRCAESLEELARRSCARADARKAITCYETVALRHAQSRLADDALFRAAKMRAAWLKDDDGALAILARLRKQYPKGDMAANAAALEKAIRASASGKTAPEAVRQVASASADTFEDTSPKQDRARRNFSGNLPLRFKAAKSRARNLRKDSLRSCWRQPWEQLQDEFESISRAGKEAIGPAAQFEAALCQQQIAACSRLSKDGKKAADMLEKFAASYPRHEKADDALLEAARAQLNMRDGEQKALKTLRRLTARYPERETIAAANKMMARLARDKAPAGSGAAANAARKSKPAPKSELQVLSWDSINKNRVEIVLELSSPAKYAARLEKKADNAQARLIVDLENATIVDDVRKGVKVNGSLLRAVRARDGKNGASLEFDFRAARAYDIRSEDNPSRIILNVAAGNARLPAEKKKTVLAKKDAPPAYAKVNANQVCDLASQLGLTVKRVFIDAGHGGKDPGTMHNKIVERAITLDVATTLGRLLKANGMEVLYSRKTDKAIALSERTRMANAAHADLFVSIHVNANDNPAASGFETYYLDLATNSQAARVAMLENASSDRRLGDMQSMLAEVMLHARAHESRNLAADIQRVAIFRLKKRQYTVRNNGVKSAPFHVLLGARMPAVLVELGYCSNAAEARNLATPKYRQALAEGLAEGIMAYRDRLLRNRTADKAIDAGKS